MDFTFKALSFSRCVCAVLLLCVQATASVAVPGTSSAGDKASVAISPLEINGEVAPIHIITIPRLEVFANVGLARQSGYLTTQDSAGSYLLGLHILAPRGAFAFEFGGFQVDHTTGEFPLANNRDVSVATFAWMSYLTVAACPSTSLMLGLGPAVVSLTQTSPEYRVSYGTFIFGGLVRHEFNQKWSLQLKSQWFNTEKVENSVTTSFEVWQNTLGVGYAWN